MKWLVDDAGDLLNLDHVQVLQVNLGVLSAVTPTGAVWELCYGDDVAPVLRMIVAWIDRDESSVYSIEDARAELGAKL